jgi:membrane associated rhomboid family serine protease
MPGGDIKTCPKCGALITPQLKRCRQCGHYLHGTAVEGWLMGLLPGNLREYPATGVLMGLILLIHVLLVVLAGPESALGFSTFTLNQLGAMFAPGFLLGEWWRPVTSVFLHAGPLHILFNLWALSVAGRYVEQLYDAKKMFVIFMSAGVVGGLLSLGYKMYLRGDYIAMSVGASGAVCGLIGATMMGARRMGPEGRPLFMDMVRWSLILLVIGFFLPRIDNAAHVGGFLVGAGFAYLVPLGLTQTVIRQKLLSLLALAMLLGVVVTFGYVGYRVHDQPLSVKHSAEPRYLLFFKVSEGEDPDTSGQRALLEDCVKPAERVFRAVRKKRGIESFEWEMLQRLQVPQYRLLLQDVKVTQAMVRRCEIALRANPTLRIAYDMLAALYFKTGEQDKARVLQDLIDEIYTRK